MADEQSLARKLTERATKRVNELTGSGKTDVDNENAIVEADFSNLPLKPDHIARPCWVCPDGTIYLEAFHDLYLQAYDFLVAIAEPVARPEFIHQYKLTPFALYAAVATNIETKSIITVLERLSKNKLPRQVEKFIHDCTSKYGKVKLVLRHNKFYVESEYPSILKELLRDKIIDQARVKDDSDTVGEDGFVTSAKAEEMEENLTLLRDPDEDSDDDGDGDGGPGQGGGGQPKTVVSFQISGDQYELVKRQASVMDYPLMEEYSFREDIRNPNIPMFDLKPITRIRRYQERSLAKMFGNGRARSGIIVLPCGAGKTLTGVTAAQTIKKSCVALATNAVSVAQWKYQFQKWTNIPDDRICVFTSDSKQEIPKEACVLVTTYTMLSFAGRRSEAAQKVMDQIAGREWGLLLMDEVHVVPAKMFRRVISTVKAHCKLGLTATLVREDDLINDLNFLIGPKLYEANWMDLTAMGYLANVQCVEVHCPMTRMFFDKYLEANNARIKQLLYVMNPNKLRAVEFLVRFHEERGDKIIIFSDLVYSLKLYADMLKRPMIYGETPEKERRVILGEFRARDDIRTICLSKVGDTSIDLPEANVIIQVSSHFGSRRQEAQRLGRILRPKSYTQQDGSNRSSFNAFFYTLVSSDTQEMFYSAKRQQYLIDQGYTFKVVTNLCDRAQEEAVKNDYKFKTKDDDLGMLRTVMNAEVDIEKEQRQEDSAIRKNNTDGAQMADQGTKRTGGMRMDQISGGSGSRYREIASTKRHPLFRKRKR